MTEIENEDIPRLRSMASDFKMPALTVGRKDYHNDVSARSDMKPHLAYLLHYNMFDDFLEPAKDGYFIMPEHRKLKYEQMPSSTNEELDLKQRAKRQLTSAYSTRIVLYIDRDTVVDLGRSYVDYPYDRVY